MNKILSLLFVVFLFAFSIQAQKLEKCKVKKNSDVPKYKIAKWERNTMANPPTLLIFVGLKTKEIDKENLIALAKHFEKKFCKEPRASFWIFTDYNSASRPFDDVGSPWEGTIQSSIMGYYFDRDTNENYLEYNMDGGSKR